MRYHQYLKVNQFGNELVKGKLQLRVAQRSDQRFGNLKVLDDAMAKMPGTTKFCTHVLHLESKVVFGSQKCKLDMLIGDEQESHRLDQVTFTCPQVETRSS
jgi:hypothetical protein